MHDIVIGHITVSKDNFINIELFDQFGQFRLGIDVDAVGIQRSCQFFWILATFDIWDLGGGEGYNLILIVITIVSIEIVEVTTGSSHDDCTNTTHKILLCSYWFLLFYIT